MWKIPNINKLKKVSIDRFKRNKKNKTFLCCLETVLNLEECVTLHIYNEKLNF